MSSVPAVVERHPLRTAVNVRGVIIIAGDRIKMHARGNGVCIVVLHVNWHVCTRVIGVYWNRGTLIRDWAEGRVGPGGGRCPDGHGHLGRRSSPAGIGMVAIAAHSYRAADPVARSTLVGP